MTTTITPRVQKYLPVRHTISYLALLCLVLAIPLTAAAAGLGKVSGNPVMGEPLTLEVPLIEAENVTPECIQLLPHASTSDSQFFPRKATIDLKRKKDGNQALITIRGPEFTQPVLEFRLTVGCGNQISRDYVLLPSPGRELRYDPVPITKPAVMPVAENSPHVIVKDAGNSVSPSGSSLNRMAKQRYPLQPKARAKFKRMVREANASTLDGIADNEPIPANANLQIPANIPKKRVGPYIPKVNKAVPAPSAKPKPADPAKPEETKAPAPAEKPTPTQAPVATPPPKDRLTISSGVGTSGATQPAGSPDGVLQEKAASFTAQEDLVAKLAQSESSHNELKQQVLAMENRMAALEQERQRLQKETINKSDWALVETTGMILVGGLLGALLMIIMQRRRRGSFAEPTFDLGTSGRR